MINVYEIKVVERNFYGKKYLCGYVAFPERHPWYGAPAEHADEFGHNVHGGITFVGYLDGQYCWGWDYLHAFSPHAEKEEVMGEAEKLIEDIESKVKA